MSRAQRVSVVAILVLMLSVPWLQAQVTGDTNFYEHSRVVYYEGYGNVCADYGAGCMESWNYNGEVVVYDYNVGAFVDMFLLEYAQEVACQALGWWWLCFP